MNFDFASLTRSPTPASGPSIRDLRPEPPLDERIAPSAGVAPPKNQVFKARLSDGVTE